MNGQIRRNDENPMFPPLHNMAGGRHEFVDS